MNLPSPAKLLLSFAFLAVSLGAGNLELTSSSGPTGSRVQVAVWYRGASEVSHLVQSGFAFDHTGLEYVGAELADGIAARFPTVTNFALAPSGTAISLILSNTNLMADLRPDTLIGTVTFTIKPGTAVGTIPLPWRAVFIDGVNQMADSTDGEVAVTGGNRRPAATGDTYTTAGSAGLTIPAVLGVLANDTDADGDDLTAVKSSDPAHGTVELNGDGSFTYAPTPGYAGSDSFTYTANDGTEDSVAATVTITVTNQAPEAADDSYSTLRDTVLTVPAPGVLANDTDANGDDLTAGPTGDPVHGAVTLNADGSFTYTPAAGFIGTDSFAYAADDGADGSVAATVSIVVGGGNPFGEPVVYVGTAMTVLLGVSRAAGDVVAGEVVGAFVGDELRGRTAVTDVDGTLYANLTIYVDQAGETIGFRLYDASADRTENGNQTVSAQAGGSLGTPEEPVEVIFGLGTQEISLLPGWNHVSLNVRPIDPSGDACFASISGALLKAIGGGGNYTPGWGDLNTFTTFADGVGYWVMVAQAATWSVEGAPLGATATPIPLAVGWNDVAFIGSSPSAADGALAGIMGDLEKVIGVGTNYTPGWGALNTLTTMRPGVGYWVKMKRAATLSYGFAPPPGGRSSVPAGRAVTGWTAAQPNPPATAHTILAVATLDGTPVAAGAKLGVFVDGQCRAVGDAIATDGQSFFNLTVAMGTAGETAVFRLYDAARDAVLDADVTMTLTPGAADGTPESPVVIAYLSLVARHTVTFKPGTHGALVGGTPDVAANVADGDPLPAVPAVVADEGWTHAGWDWQATTRADAPTTVTQDWTVTALYAEAAATAPPWAVDLTLAGAAPTTLTFGMRSDATDGWDGGIDVQSPLLGPARACLASDDLSLSYSADYRAPAEAGEFLLIASAGPDAPATVSWDVSGLDEGKFLTVYQVLLADIVPDRAPVARILVGNTAQNMGQTGSLEVPAGETRCYVLRYGDELVFDLAVWPGWNLVSLPIEPTNPTVDAVLVNGLARGDTELRDGWCGPVSSRHVWTWQGQAYVAVNEMHACVGYWVHATEATVLLTEGTSVNQTAFDLVRGWNQCGTDIPRHVPADPRIVGTPWALAAGLMRYQATSDLRPGWGYWINASENATIPLSPR